MKTIKTYEEASRMAVVGTGSHIDYNGPEHETVAQKFKNRYGVEPIHVEEDENYLIIPCTREIEQDFCYDEERMEEVCSEMGLSMENFEF